MFKYTSIIEAESVRNKKEILRTSPVIFDKQSFWPTYDEKEWLAHALNYKIMGTCCNSNSNNNNGTCSNSNAIRGQVGKGSKRQSCNPGNHD